MRSFFVLFYLLFHFTVSAQQWTLLPDQPEELGYVKWVRSFEEAKQLAIKQNKSIFILFQEVPGCSTCKNYGNDLLTHPHIVEVLETHFIPLAIFNNKKGSDAEILRKYNEPSWNNPVARIIAPSTEKDILPRLSGRYDMAHLTDFIQKGLLNTNQIIPTYFNLLSMEYAQGDIRNTNLSMFCFWSGEKNLGELDGVLSTRAGYMNGHEVVQVVYNADLVKDEELLEFAKERKCADGVFSKDQRQILSAKKLGLPTKNEGKFRPDSEPKYYLYKSKYRSIPMTNLQSIKVNNAISKGQSPESFLSPRQLEYFSAFKQNSKSTVDEDFASTWNSSAIIHKKND